MRNVVSVISVDTKQRPDHNAIHTDAKSFSSCEKKAPRQGNAQFWTFPTETLLLNHSESLPRVISGGLHLHSHSFLGGTTMSGHPFFPGLHPGVGFLVGFAVVVGLVSVLLFCSIQRLLGSPCTGNFSHAMCTGHWNPYCFIMGTQPFLALSQTLLQAGSGMR